MARWTLGRSGAVPVLALLAASCTDLPPTEPSALEPDAPNLALSAQMPPGMTRGIDAEFVRTANEVPGFGGLYYDESGRMVVVMAGDPDRTLDARSDETLRRRIQETRGVAAATAEIVIQQGDYDFIELDAINRRVLPVLAVGGVVLTHIDERRNRVRVGVDGPAAAQAVEEWLAAHDVPREAVIIEETEPIRPMTGHTLRNRVRPVAGGLQIAFERPGVGFFVCTLGANVRVSGPGASQPHFITNSHCTAERSTVTGTTYWQHSPFADETEIGVEVLDPPFFTAPCFAGWVCRWSDASMARYNRGGGAALSFGSIYRTKSFGTGVSAGSLEIEEDTPPRFRIVADEPFPVLGETLNKIGRTTGWTRGDVAATCVHVGVAGAVPPTAMLCQDIVLASVAGGDSGSPVFRQVDDSRDVVFYGLLWGGGTGLFVFSALDNIQFELGPFATH